MILAAGRTSSAATITGTGSDFSITWSFACGAVTCTGDASFDVTSFDATTLIMEVTVNNTLDSPGQFLTGIGWNMDPVATAASMVTPGQFLDNVRLDQTFPSFNTLNVCVDDNGQGSCGAGQVPDGLPFGSDTFTLSLTGDFSGGTATLLEPFALKYAGELGSFEGGSGPGGSGPGGTSGPGGSEPGGEIPEPTTLLLMGSGLAAAAARLRRKQN
jgi:PEP-CTERM motif